ncbi:DUF72 domain-containing protein [Paenibacillus sp. SYP-B4298]|uniref:DUF72 domain-containing protein n=1 Tax=Paenibacillus sp. SYP-B4298 TaxID=2996034 RepID=UPI0022DCF3C6|nr:DUF72 domain-containing protein [Paenibacillus sp. SYP-B4298]
MIRIGLTGWGDHVSLYPDREAAANKLKTYSEWFETVEVDSMFYAVQPQKNMQKWTEETPDSFRFLVKAYQGMTGHSRGKLPFDSEEAMYTAFHASLQPMQEAGKLEAVLFQFPPWFDCKREHVGILREAKRRMGDVPCALEFRHRSWFEPQMRQRTLHFMREEGWIHSLCDEPQVGAGCVPIVEEVTHSELTVVRLHGRNEKGWQSSGQPNWREVRYLYRYSEAELLEWAERLQRLAQQTARLCVIFNNNSGGDAADNGKQMLALLGKVPPRGTFAPVLPGQEKPEQLELF